MTEEFSFFENVLTGPRPNCQNKRVGKSADFLPNFFTLTEKCIANDICDAGGALFFTFPPAGSTNKRVGKVCLTFLPNFEDVG